MKTLSADPFANVPDNAQVTIFVWSGGRRPSSTKACSYSRSFARHTIEQAIARPGTTKVQIAAAWPDPAGAFWDRRIDITNAGVADPRDRDLSSNKAPHRKRQPVDALDLFSLEEAFR